MSSIRGSRILPVGITSSYKLPFDTSFVSLPWPVFILMLVILVCMSYVSPDFKHLNDTSRVSYHLFVTAVPNRVFLLTAS